MNNKYHVKITDQAYSHILEIADYIAIELCNKQASINLVNKIRKSVLILEDFPFLYPIINIEGINDEIRKINVDDFLVYYLVDVSNCIVNIIGIIWSRREQYGIIKKIIDGIVN